jgi:hypothetical protein
MVHDAWLLLRDGEGARSPFRTYRPPANATPASPSSPRTSAASSAPTSARPSSPTPPIGLLVSGSNRTAFEVVASDAEDALATTTPEFDPADGETGPSPTTVLLTPCPLLDHVDGPRTSRSTPSMDTHPSTGAASISDRMTLRAAAVNRRLSAVCLRQMLVTGAAPATAATNRHPLASSFRNAHGRRMA